jgi:type II secretory pathway pseudopilin PulG
MTTTALMPVDPTVSPQQAARILTIRADLLPPEIRDGRRARRTRSLVVLLLVVTLAGLGTWYWQATLAKQGADDEYAATFQSLNDARNAQRKNQDIQNLIQYKQDGETLNEELKVVLADDLSWSNLINLVNEVAREQRVELTEVTGALAEKNAAGTDGTMVGTLTLTGTAANKRIVADYVNELGTLKHVTNPFVTTVSTEEEVVNFTLTVNVTEQARCGRFTTDCPSEGE